jgi:hypothetical protein
MGDPSLWDEASARALVSAVVSQKLGLFAAYQSQVGVDDLHSEALGAAHRGFARFDPTRSSFSTFVTLCAGRRLLTLARDLGRRARRERTGQEIRIALQKPDREHVEPDDLADWLGQTHRQIRLIYKTMMMPLRAPRARPDYPDRAQRAALLLLKNRLSASNRGLAFVLRTRPELLAALHLSSPLSFGTISRLENSVALSAKGQRSEVRV